MNPPEPRQAYALWLDSLSRAGWAAGPAAGSRAERVPVADALGRVTAAPVTARWPSPRSDCAAMDGIAVSAAIMSAAVAGAAVADAAVADAAVADAAVAGAADPGEGAGGGAAADAVRVPAGTFEWIDTGDPMPDGTDTVVVRERLLPRADGSVLITRGADGDVTDGAGVTAAGETIVARGRHVRPAGEDFAAGEVLVPAGRRLRPGDLAAAAADGRVSLAVARRPVVAIIPTGDEIRPAGSALRHGDIIDTNSVMLAARCRLAGAVPMVSDVQPDDPDALASGIRQAALGADLVLVIAGSSHGRGDHAGAVLAQVGGVAVTGVAIRPGHPALLGHVKRPSAGPGRRGERDRTGIAPVIGLPGYPLAAAVVFELFAAPLLATVGGRPGPPGPPRPSLVATLDRDWSSPAGIEEWVLVTLSPAPAPALSAATADSLAGLLPVASPARRGAGSISQLARADAWWPIPAGSRSVAAGTAIGVLPIPGG